MLDAVTGKEAVNLRNTLREPYFTTSNLVPLESKDGVSSAHAVTTDTESCGLLFDDHITPLMYLPTDQISTFQLAANLFNLDDSYEQ